MQCATSQNFENRFIPFFIKLISNRSFHWGNYEKGLFETNYTTFDNYSLKEQHKFLDLTYNQMVFFLSEGEGIIGNCADGRHQRDNRHSNRFTR